METISAEKSSNTRLKSTYRSPKQQSILNAVFKCCAQYGYRRTSMEDIAIEAGISRTALYYYFKNKEEVFQALADWFHDQVDDEIASALAFQGPVDLSILKVLEARMGLFFDLVHLSAHGKEVADSTNQIAGKAASEQKENFLQLLSNKLLNLQETGDIDVGSAGFTTHEAAQFLIDCAEGLMAAPETGSGVKASISMQLSAIEYRRRLALLVHTVVTAWGGKTSYKPKTKAAK